jgi:hypothetical protein
MATNYDNIYITDENTIDVTADIVPSSDLTVGKLRDIMNHPLLDGELDLPVRLRLTNGDSTSVAAGIPVSVDITIQDLTGDREFSIAYVVEDH